MNMTRPATLSASPGISRNQRGVALLTALVFLVILTLLGIGVFSTTTSDEKMARNFRDREIALQAAQAALNEAEIQITASYNTASPPSPLPQPLTADNCPSTITGFACEPSGITDYKSYDLFASGANYAAVSSNPKVPSTLSPSIAGLSAQPRYLIVLEANPTPCGESPQSKLSCFKILAQAKGRLSTTRVNLIEQFTN